MLSIMLYYSDFAIFNLGNAKSCLFGFISVSWDEEDKNNGDLMKRGWLLYGMLI